MPSEKFKFLSARFVLATLFAALGSAFHHGYHVTILIVSLVHSLDLTDAVRRERYGEGISHEDAFKTHWKLTYAFFAGGLLGGALTAVVAEKLGRKKGLLVSNIFLLVSAAFMASAKKAVSHEMLAVGLFLAGITAGLGSGLGPMYLTEISPVSYRGAVGTVYQLMFVIAAWFPYVLSLSPALWSRKGWPFLFVAPVIAAILTLIALPFCPESPKYLFLVKGQHEEAERALRILRPTEETITSEMEMLASEAESTKVTRKVKWTDMIRNPALRTALGISVLVTLTNQYMVFNRALFYMFELYMPDAGREAFHSHIHAPLAEGAIQIVTTVVSLVVVEVIGRRRLLLGSFAAMAVFNMIITGAVALKFHAPWLLYPGYIGMIGFLVTFSLGPGCMRRFLVTELVGQSERPIAMCIVVIVDWTAHIALGHPVFYLFESAGIYLGIVYAILLPIPWLYIYKKLPETKNKTIEEVTKSFKS